MKEARQAHATGREEGACLRACLLSVHLSVCPFTLLHTPSRRFALAALLILSARSLATLFSHPANWLKKCTRLLMTGSVIEWPLVLFCYSGHLLARLSSCVATKAHRGRKATKKNMTYARLYHPCDHATTQTHRESTTHTQHSPLSSALDHSVSSVCPLLTFSHRHR